MDDMSCKMQAYQTKLQLLYENPENITAALERSGQLLDTEQLIDLESRRLLQMVLVPVKECPISSDYSKSRRSILRTCRKSMKPSASRRRRMSYSWPRLNRPFTQNLSTRAPRCRRETHNNEAKEQKLQACLTTLKGTLQPKSNRWPPSKVKW
nr:uncharacterized protein LOC118876983 [Drosophila suzukii]